MQYIDQLAQSNLTGPTMVSVGSYDGIHIGHQHLLETMRKAAASQGYQTAVVTFHPRPKVALGKHAANKYLTTSDERNSLFEALGIDLLAVLAFTPEMASMPAVQFIEDMMTQLGMRQLWVGPEFALGRNRDGDIPSLRQLGQNMGFELKVVDQMMWKDELVSSTRIRTLLSEGQIREASYLLGRYPSLKGKVVRGDQRGRRIGFPTANIAVPSELAVPANGVYACFAQTGEGRWPAVTNVGVRPTFGGEIRTVEAYLLDFNGDLYDQELTLEFVDYLRPEVHFEGIAMLSAQIRVDVERASSLLEQEEIAKGTEELW